GLRDAPGVRLLPRRRVAAAGERDNIHEPEAADGVHVMSCDKPGADEPHSNSLHRDLFSRLSQRSPFDVAQGDPEALEGSATSRLARAAGALLPPAFQHSYNTVPHPHSTI